MEIELADIWGLLLAVLLGAIIGAERQIDNKPAGLRTNILICLGAAMFTIISREMGGQESATRIAAQIVSGIGFLGAGAIIRDQAGIHGLTTAATIWMVASIGMACGAGFYLHAAIGAGIAFSVLLLLRPLSRKISSLPRTPDSQQQGEE